MIGFYLNVVGYKAIGHGLNVINATEKFYLNVVGYKDQKKQIITFAIIVLSERSGI
ncbi:hypothetical protein HMPREF1015_01170 [Bacillus smithii 7_3_47FAA]|uniref:Uncharacterized protein n=1 Tax=Bacillus smithii 7_3_47FAA TaxID=665952 RepID=G9QHB1_9BACI|nr:hypothetical protein HMPREF1015_01170 [Bacillus smithii 7_3_47FAA]